MAINPKSTLKIKYQDKWVKCDLGYVGFGNNGFIRVYVRDGWFDIHGPRNDLVRALGWLQAQAEGNPPDQMVTESSKPAHDPVTNMVTPGAVASSNAVTKVTPAQVTEYFRSSPELSSLADDVEQVMNEIDPVDQLRLDVEAVLADYELSDLFGDDNQPVYGAQSKVAQSLGVPNAGSYRARIMSVLLELRRKISTTTAKKPAKQSKTA